MKKFSPKRKKVVQKGQEIWTYEDPKEHALMIKAAIFNVNLIDFDTWLSKLEACEAKEELIERRQAAVDAKNIAVLKRHLEFMVLQWSSISREEALLPLAKRGIKSQDDKKRAAIASKKIRQKNTDKLLQSIGELHKKMLAEFEKKDQTLLNIHLIREFKKLYQIEISAYLIRKAKASPIAKN